MTQEDLKVTLPSITGLTAEQVESGINAMVSAINRFCCDLDSVAIPGFGTFETIKHDEMIVEDVPTGKRMLLPPKIEVVFKPSVVLRKKFIG